MASLGINTQALFSGSSVSSNSPLNSPLLSPAGSPYPLDPSWDQLQNQFSLQMSLHPPPPPLSATIPITNKSGSNNTFVHKLYNMVVDKQYQHLIAWTYTGSSFVVCNITEFSRDVLPKHFKHNNFSSFVRQLNMYGFHKINKSPRGHRTQAENQIWEFSHSKFVRNRPDLLDDIKRKALETDSGKREPGDLNSQMAVMQMSQSDMLQKISQLTQSLNQVMHELTETKKTQGIQQKIIKDMAGAITKQYGVTFQIPSELMEPVGTMDTRQHPERPPPPIYVTTPEQHQQEQNLYLNLSQHRISIPRSPSITSNYQSSVHSPLSPSPCTPNFLSDDEANSIYAPRSPLTPGAYLIEQQQQQEQQGVSSQHSYQQHFNQRFTN
ncbi:HSF-type DNA-binding-domain-containing protein [Sporodiniella umbellata]|nr:HSF-type DNA-binding-domain-containing protein [Sporodiniella umbellata]